MNIEFHERDGVHTGTSESGRRWRITRTLTGWRLEFIDPGDAAPTNAGVHASVSAAQVEANSPTRTRRRSDGSAGGQSAGRSFTPL